MNASKQFLSKIFLTFLSALCFASLRILPSEKSYTWRKTQRCVRILRTIPEVNAECAQSRDIDSEIRAQQVAWNEALDKRDVDSAHDRVEKIKELLKEKKLLRRDRVSDSTY